LSDQHVTSRIQEIQTQLDGGKTNANIWWYGWLYGYAGLTALRLTGIFIVEKKTP
jgi:hypothetical protein